MDHFNLLSTYKNADSGNSTETTRAEVETRNKLNLIDLIEIGTNGCSSEVGKLQYKVFETIGGVDTMLAQEFYTLAISFRDYICLNLCSEFDNCTNYGAKTKKGNTQRSYESPRDFVTKNVVLEPERLHDLTRIVRVYKIDQ